MDPMGGKSSDENRVTVEQMDELTAQVRMLRGQGKFDKAEETLQQFIQSNKDKMSEAEYVKTQLFLCEHYSEVGHWQNVLSLTTLLRARFPNVDPPSMGWKERSWLGIIYFYQATSLFKIAGERCLQPAIYENIMSLLTKAIAMGLRVVLYHSACDLTFTLRIKKMHFEKAGKSEWEDLGNKLKEHIDEEHEYEDTGVLSFAYFMRGHVYRLLEKKTDSDKDFEKIPQKMRGSLEAEYDELVNMPPFPTAGSSSDNAEKQNEMSTGNSSTIPAPSEPVAAGVASEETAGSSHGYSDGEISVEHLYDQALQLTKEYNKNPADKKLLREVADLYEQLLVLVRDKEKYVLVYRDVLGKLCSAYTGLEEWKDLSSLSEELIKVYSLAKDSQDPVSRSQLGRGYFYKATSLWKIQAAGKPSPQTCTEIEYSLRKAIPLATHQGFFHSLQVRLIIVSIQKLCYENAKPSDWGSLQKETDFYLETYGPSLAQNPPCDVKDNILLAYFWRACMYGLLEKEAEAEADLKMLVQYTSLDMVKRLTMEFPILTCKPLPPVVAAFLSGKRERQSQVMGAGNSTALALTWFQRAQKREKLVMTEMGKAYKSMRAHSFIEAQLALKEVMHVMLIKRGMSNEERAQAEVLVRGRELPKSASQKKGHGKASKKAVVAQDSELVAQEVGVNASKALVRKLLNQVVLYIRAKRGREVASLLSTLRTWDVETVGASNYENLVQICCGLSTRAFRQGDWKKLSDWTEVLLGMSELLKGFMGFWWLADKADLEGQHRFSSFFLSLVESVLMYATQEQRAVLSDIESAEHGVVLMLLNATRKLSVTRVEKVKPRKDRPLTKEEDAQNYVVFRLGQTHQSATDILREFDGVALAADVAREAAAGVEAEAVNQSSATHTKPRR